MNRMHGTERLESLRETQTGWNKDAQPILMWLMIKRNKENMPSTLRSNMRAQENTGIEHRDDTFKSMMHFLPFSLILFAHSFGCRWYCFCLCTRNSPHGMRIWALLFLSIDSFFDLNAVFLLCFQRERRKKEKKSLTHVLCWVCVFAPFTPVVRSSQIVSLDICMLMMMLSFFTQHTHSTFVSTVLRLLHQMHTRFIYKLNAVILLNVYACFFLYYFLCCTHRILQYIYYYFIFFVRCSICVCSWMWSMFIGSVYRCFFPFLRLLWTWLLFNYFFMRAYKLIVPFLDFNFNHFTQCFYWFYN